MTGRAPPALTALGPATQEAWTPFIGSTRSPEITEALVGGAAQPAPVVEQGGNGVLSGYR
ncbi:hypothetical protein GCM10009530_77150 [Microbispora corallina]|uniref:Uncharacterized protein n=1 Tax=Microbispora corallina TaxID=83302 RepID=A0ABQ4GCH7_9ACTN|nr:hypothetical protein Mco01_77470 [Microbispora corallina]